MPEIRLFDAMYSARALRRLKPDPVPEEIITRILDAAIRAPSAGNAQNWAFIVVRDVEQRRRLGMIYRKASDIASEIYKARGRPAHMTDEQFRRFLTSGAYFTRNQFLCIDSLFFAQHLGFNWCSPRWHLVNH